MLRLSHIEPPSRFPSLSSTDSRRRTASPQPHLAPKIAASGAANTSKIRENGIGSQDQPALDTILKINWRYLKDFRI
jgi:hypothetical protein